MCEVNTMTTMEERASAMPLNLDSPMSGELVSLDQVPDPLFSSGTMGGGIAILPKTGMVVAPCDGIVLFNRSFSHMIGLIAAGGVEILIHIGLDRRRMAKNPFHFLVKENQRVKKGDPLLTADLKALQEAGNELYTPVIITNLARYVSVAFPRRRTVRAGDRLMTLS